MSVLGIHEDLGLRDLAIEIELHQVHILAVESLAYGTTY